MGVDDREPAEAARPTVFAVGPVRRDHVLPRVIAVALAVGTLAFMAGLQVGAGGTAARVGGSDPAPTPSVAPSATPPPVFDPPGSSAFVQAFRPPELIAAIPDGAACVTSTGQEVVPRTRRDGPRLTFVRYWMTFCPLEAGRRQSFLLAVIDALVRQVPSETHGFASSAGGAGQALFPYAESPFVGTVTLSADAAGSGLEIVITLEERLAQ